ncbi:hypothetical protein F4778DRAFT_215291 [Xylariomycetidae sp. FL2044]|nr:hypothetical protein F4778DRAFT_215291 [Xylariomycetidae sp. FL2044]
MRSDTRFHILFWTAFARAAGARTTAPGAGAGGCPTDELACHDVMNSSQCIAQMILDQAAPVDEEALLGCLEYEGAASDLPAATKYCLCSGCHTAAINEAIAEMFPPPCS